MAGAALRKKKYIIGSKEYLLRVVYEEQKDLGVVITAYLTSQVMRYWKEGKDEDFEYDPTHDLLNIEFIPKESISESVELDGVIIDYRRMEELFPSKFSMRERELLKDRWICSILR